VEGRSWQKRPERKDSGSTSKGDSSASANNHRAEHLRIIQDQQHLQDQRQGLQYGMRGLERTQNLYSIQEKLRQEQSKKREGTSSERTASNLAEELARRRVPDNLRPDGRPAHYNGKTLQGDFRRIAAAHEDVKNATAEAANLAKVARSIPHGGGLTDAYYTHRVVPAREEVVRSEEALRQKVSEDPRTHTRRIFTVGPDSDRE